MSGFDLPPVVGFDALYTRAQQGMGRGVEGLTGEGLPSAPGVPAPDGVGKPEGFEGVLSDSLGAMRSLQNDVAEKYKGLVLGEDVELHDVMLAANKSEVTFNLMLEVRNKLVEAWEKLSRSAV
jgi:flagellar hook-basal body complex protein FliE